MQSPLLVACLCAQWCGVCRDYLVVFEAFAASTTAQTAWVDVEDHAEVLGDIDVDDFPTLLIARGDEVVFFGPITPHATTLARLAQRAAAGELAAVVDARLQGLPRRVRAAAAAL